LLFSHGINVPAARGSLLLFAERFRSLLIGHLENVRFFLRNITGTQFVQNGKPVYSGPRTAWCSRVNLCYPWRGIFGLGNYHGK